MAEEFAAIDTRSEILQIISRLVADETETARQPRRVGQRS